MKKTIFFILTIISVSAKAQTSVYHPFPDSNAVWNEWYANTVSCSSNPPYYDEWYSYLIDGDTIISSSTYHKLVIPYVQRDGDTTCPTFPAAGYSGCIRQDILNKKVFFINPGNTIEWLLYDFNLQVGDTLGTHTVIGCIGTDVTVSWIDSVLIGSDYRKRWSFQMVSFPGLSFPYLIEGIGWTTGLLEFHCHYLDDLNFFNLVCFQQNNIILYHPFTQYGCELISSIKNIFEKNISVIISPNPFTSSLSITLQNQNIKQATISIKNILGQTVFLKEIKTPGKEIKVDLSFLERGIYLVEVGADGERTVKKVIKE